MRASLLRVGDKVLTKDGTSVTVIGTEHRTESRTVFNLGVAQIQNYLVGPTGVLVHNLKDEETE